MYSKFLLKGIILFLSLGAVFTSLSGQKSAIQKGLAAITSEKMKSHIDFLASDALMGRNTPSAGLDTAAAYIVREFKKYGVQPVNGTYLHPVPLVIRSLGTDNFVEINNNGVTQSLKIKTGFVPFEVTANGEATGNIVFAGYGITAPEYNYDDYAGLDVKGKIVFVLRHEPGEDDTSSVFDGRNNTKHNSIESKVKNAMDHGAVGVMVITDPLNHQLLNPRGFPWPSLSSVIPKDALPMTLISESRSLPVVHVGKEVANILFGSIDSLKSIQQTIDKNMKPWTKDFPSVSVHMKTSILDNPVKTNNVIGIIPGTDPVLKNEYLIVGAHYDHVGFVKNHTDVEDYIINGADDNASGTAGVIAVAEAFSKMKAKPKRSVLFMGFSAEEKGLFGSEAYVTNPLFPLEKTVAMLNMDMISRNHIDSLDLEGAEICPDLVDVVIEENKGIGFKLSLNKDEHVGGSDHASFYNKKIPFIFFFAGLHPDYHTVRDNPDTINPAKASRISQLVFKTAWNVANSSMRYQIIEKK